jgi:hypothetical protein
LQIISATVLSRFTCWLRKTLKHPVGSDEVLNNKSRDINMMDKDVILLSSRFNCQSILQQNLLSVMLNFLLYLGKQLILFRIQLRHIGVPHGAAENFIDLLDYQPDVGLESVISEQRLL